MIYTYEQYLAFELADVLKDPKHFGFYCALAKKYPASKIFYTLSDLFQLPNIKKIKNKGAYFTKLFFKKCH